MKPNIVLVHGAFAESSSWDGVVPLLQSEGHRVVSFANPLRGVATDADLLTDLVRTLQGPVVLVGHSYGGAVITNVDREAARIAALVYVAGFALQPGETCVEASALAPGSTLGETLVPVPLGSGGTDLYIDPERYHAQFAADLDADTAQAMAVGQRPVRQEALGEPSGDEPLWHSEPSWFLWGAQDRNIPAAAHRIMAERARARRAVEVPGASHVVGISHPAETAELILAAAGESASSAA